MNKQIFDEQPQRPSIEDAEAGIESLLREVGSRDEPAPEITAAIRHAVHAEWQSVVAQRAHQAQRRRTMTYGIAASMLSMVIAVAVVLKFTAAPDGATAPIQVASVAKVQGLLQVAEGNHWRDVQTGEVLTSGAQLRTGRAARVALNYNSISVRIDEDSLLTLNAADRISLQHGRVYIDAPADRHVPLVLQTLAGQFAHLGTQYQVQVNDEDAVLSVREGRVALARATEVVHEIAGGEQLVIDAQGVLTRAEISPLDASWLWALQIAPSFDIENQSLAKFLEWVARETGKTVRYATPEARKQAEALLLRGSVSTLNPEQALRAVMATTGFLLNETATELELRIPGGK